MNLFKRCLLCKKMVFKKYDIIEYEALDDRTYEPKKYKAYVCRSHIPEEPNRKDDVDSDPI